jgi:hypothetical protein
MRGRLPPNVRATAPPLRVRVRTGFVATG